MLRVIISHHDKTRYAQIEKVISEEDSDGERDTFSSIMFFFSFFLQEILEPSQSHSHTKKRSRTTPAPVFPAGRDKKRPPQFKPAPILLFQISTAPAGEFYPQKIQNCHYCRPNVIASLHCSSPLFSHIDERLIREEKWQE